MLRFNHTGEGLVLVSKILERCTSIHAIIIRDLMTRYGRNHLGFVWVILEPMILCSGVMVIWSFIHEPVMHGIPILELVFTGYMPLTLWRHLTNPMPLILRRNSGVLYHRPVSHVDIQLSRSILEFLATSLGATIIYFFLWSTGLIEDMHRPDLVLAGWLYTGWYYGAMGVFIGAFTEYWELGEKFVQPANYLMLPLSGVFFMVDWMPNYAQHLLLLNPSVHCFEMIRAGFSGGALTTHYSLIYITISSMAISLLAAATLYHVRDSVQVA